jgi:polysaccharide biosynthesis/export protein
VTMFEKEKQVIQLLKRLTALLAPAAVLIPLASAQAQTSQYRLAPGDTVEVTIAPLPDRTVRAMVQSDGTISLPLAGSISVEGLTPAELQSRLEMVLASKPYRQRMPDGREQTTLIQPGDINAAVSEFRPIYVSGDVLTPGAQPYRLLITVRQAIAVAGGFSLLRARAGTPAAAGDPVDLQRDYDSLWTEFIREHYRNARLKAQLDGKSEFDKKMPAGSPLPATVVAAIADSEAQSLKIAMENIQKERDFLLQAAKDAVDQTDLLNKRDISEAEGVKGDEEEMANVAALFKSGNVTSSRLSDVRRALLLSSSRRLETTVELMRVRRQAADVARQLERTGNDQRIALLNELKDSQVRLADLAIRLNAGAMKLHVGTAMQNKAADESLKVQTSVSISRRVGGQWEQMPADIDAELMPGDVIEAVLNGGGGLAAATR